MTRVTRVTRVTRMTRVTGVTRGTRKRGTRMDRKISWIGGTRKIREIENCRKIEITRHV